MRLSLEDSAGRLHHVERREPGLFPRKRGTEIPVAPAVIEALDEAFRGFEAADASESWEERFQLVERCFEKLPEALRQVCRLHYFEDRKAREIAAGLEMGLDAVLKRLERARRTLKECGEGQLKEMAHG